MQILQLRIFHLIANIHLNVFVVFNYVHDSNWNNCKELHYANITIENVSFQFKLKQLQTFIWLCLLYSTMNMIEIEICCKYNFIVMLQLNSNWNNCEELHYANITIENVSFECVRHIQLWTWLRMEWLQTFIWMCSLYSTMYMIENGI